MSGLWSIGMIFSGAEPLGLALQLAASTISPREQDALASDETMEQNEIVQETAMLTAGM